MKEKIDEQKIREELEALPIIELKILRTKLKAETFFKRFSGGKIKSPRLTVFNIVNEVLLKRSEENGKQQ